MSSSKTQFNDATIASSVEARFLADEEIRPLGISVTVNKRHVLLSGEAPSLEVCERIVAIARSVEGVISVVDRLVVLDPIQGSDDDF